MKVDLINNLLFENVSQDILQSDILKKPSKFVKSRTVIFSKGQKVRFLYLILDGKVNFIDYNFINRNKSDDKSRRINSGEFFGHYEISEGRKRISAAITLTDCEIVELTIDELNTLIGIDEQILANINKCDSYAALEEIQNGSSEAKDSEINSNNDLTAKVESAKEKQKKNKAEIGKIERMKDSIMREREFTNKALNKEMAEISNKEKKLKDLAALLKKEKELSKTSHSTEITELEQNKLKKKLLEDSIAIQKEKAQALIKEKEIELRNRELELQERASMIEIEEKMIESNLKNLGKNENKDSNAKTKSEMTAKQKKNIELEKELEAKEKELKKMIEDLANEKNKSAATKEKEELLKERERLLSEQGKNLDKEKRVAEEVLKSELEKIENKEKELTQREELIKKEKEEYEKKFQNEREELLQKIEHNESVNKDKPEDKKLFTEEFERIKLKEEELAKREQLLKIEIEMSENSLKKEFENLLKVEQDVEEKLAKMLESENYIQEADAKLEEYRNREEELLAKISELEKNTEMRTAGREEPGILDKKNAVKASTQSTINIPIYDTSIERDYNQSFQVESFEGVDIVFVNIQRGIAANSAKLQTKLDDLLNEGRYKIIVDLSFSDFLDSTFLGVLVTLLKKLNMKGGSLRIVLNAVKVSSSTFFLSGMDRVFNIHTDLNSAIHQLIQKKE